VAAAESGDRSRVLFLCTHNSASSQMAEGLLRHLAGDRFEAMSAGTEATHVRPLAIRAMDEIGVDISGQESKTLERYLDEPIDYVITVCDDANEACPFFPGAQSRLHWSTSGLEPLYCSLRVITQALQGCAGACKSRISKRLSLLRFARRCTVLRSRWCQSGDKGSRTACGWFPCKSRSLPSASPFLLSGTGFTTRGSPYPRGRASTGGP
jgi:arsenate reductase (thioredoxin)